MASYWSRVTAAQRHNSSSIPRRRFVKGAGVAGLGIATAATIGCGSDDDDAEDTPTQDGGSGGEPVRGGTFLITGSAPIGIQDPNFGPAPIWSTSYMGDPLLAIDAVSREISGGIIEEWQQPDDLTLTLSVRQGVKFFNMPPADGREVTAQDVVYTIGSMTGSIYPEEAIPFPRRSLFDGVERVEVLDDETVSIEFSRPRSDMINNLTEQRTAVIPEGLREHFGGIDSLNGLVTERFIGTGPFMPESLDPDTQMTWQRNPDYWNQPYPYVDRVTTNVVEDPSAWTTALISGQSMYLLSVQDQTIDLVERGLSDVQVIDYEPSGYWYHLGFNTRVTPTDDPRVRKALALVFDQPRFGASVLGEGRVRIPGPMPFVFNEALSQEELGATPGLRTPTDDDIQMARALIADAGYEDGFEIAITAAVEQLATHQYQRVSEHLKSQAEQHLPGVTIAIDATNYSGMLAKIGDPESGFHAYTGGWIHEPSPISMMALSYASTGGRNFTGYASDAMDAAIEGAYGEFDEEARTGLLRDAQAVALEDWSHLPTHHGEFAALFHPNVRSLPIGSASTPPWSIRYAWLADGG